MAGNLKYVEQSNVPNSPDAAEAAGAKNAASTSCIRPGGTPSLQTLAELLKLQMLPKWLDI
jgi:hypothetical protein